MKTVRCFRALWTNDVKCRESLHVQWHRRILVFSHSVEAYKSWLNISICSASSSGEPRAFAIYYTVFVVVSPSIFNTASLCAASEWWTCAPESPRVWSLWFFFSTRTEQKKKRMRRSLLRRRAETMAFHGVAIEQWWIVFERMSQ